MKRLLLVELVAVATLSAVAGVGFHRVFAGKSFLVPVLGAAVLPVVLSVLTRLRSSRLTTTFLVSAGGFVLYTAYAALGSTAPNLVPTATTFRQLVRGLTDGWTDLLSISLPARAEPRLLVVACAVVWFGSFLGAELAQRSRNVVAPTIAPLVAFAATLLYSAGQPRSSYIVPLALTAATLLLVLAHANRWASIEPGGLRVRRGGDDRNEASMEVSADRRVLVGLPVIAVSLVVAAVAAATPTSALRSSFDPRDLRPQDVVARDVVSPLAGVRRQLRLEPARSLFTLNIDRFSDALAVPRVRLAALDRFDGANWSASGRFTRVGSLLPEPGGLTVARREVRQTYTIDQLEGPWLPAADRPSAVQTDSVVEPVEIQFDPASGNLITDRSDLNGLTYAINSLVAIPSPESLAGLEPGAGDDFVVSTDTAGMPESIRQAARTATAGATTPWARLAALEQALRTSYGYSEEVDAGHSYGRLEKFLVTERTGYSEQFASAFAVMARALGMPSRISVGYLTAPAEADQQVAEGQITTRQVDVWPEVYFEGAGWVPFDPTPPRVPTPAPPPPPERPQVAGGGFVDAQQPPAELSTSDEFDDPDDSAINGRLLALFILFLVLVSLPFIPMVLKAARRRRRWRRARSPAQQVLGAWAEVIDSLLEVGVPLQRSLTAREVAGRSIEYVNPDASARLYAMAPLVTAAVFSPSAPGEDRALQMRALVDAFQKDLAAGRGVSARVAAALSPRPLLYTRR